jgi:hypothetical protein
LFENNSETIKTLACLGVENSCLADKRITRKAISDTDRYLISQDIDSPDNLWKDTFWSQIARERQCRAFIVIPLSDQGKVFGVRITVHQM